MNKGLNAFLLIIGITLIVTLGVFVGLRIKDDTLKEKNEAELLENKKKESEYVIGNAMEILEQIRAKIESDTSKNVVLAESGSIDKVDIFFIVLDSDSGQYKYITKYEENGEDKYKVQESEDDTKYIVSYQMLGFEDLVYTKVEDYSIDTNGVITYSELK